MNSLTRFMSKIQKDPDSGCWLWTGSKCGSTDYGEIREKRKRHLVHRWAYQRLKGEIPEGLELHHKCGVKCCVNPDHLQPVTHQEHMRIEFENPLCGICGEKKYRSSDNTLRCRPCNNRLSAEYYMKNRETVNVRRRARYHLQKEEKK